MSLIHEALQKAEAERRAGELPALLSLSKPPRKPRFSPLSLLAASAIAVLAFAAVYSNRQLILATVQPATTATDTAVAGNPAQAVEPDGAQIPQPILTPADITSTARKPDVVRATTPSQTLVEADAMPPPMPAPLPPSMSAANVAQTPAASAQAIDTAAIEPIPVPPISNAPVEPAPVVTADTPDPVPEAPAPDLPTPAAPADVVAAPVSVAPPMDPTTATDVPDAPPPAKEAVPYVFELPLETRQLLPALKVTMYVYNADPAQRFAIIDGKRVNEGGVVGQELDIVEIQRDAIMLKFRDTRFLLPRIGR